MWTTVKLRLPGMPTVLSSLLELFSIIFFIYVFNNYLLTGKKVDIFFPRQARDNLSPEQREGNNKLRACRGKKHFFNS